MSYSDIRKRNSSDLGSHKMGKGLGEGEVCKKNIYRLLQQARSPKDLEIQRVAMNGEEGGGEKLKLRDGVILGVKETNFER